MFSRRGPCGAASQHTAFPACGCGPGRRARVLTHRNVCIQVAMPAQAPGFLSLRQPTLDTADGEPQSSVNSSGYFTAADAGTLSFWAEVSGRKRETDTHPVTDAGGAGLGQGCRPTSALPSQVDALASAGHGCHSPGCGQRSACAPPPPFLGPPAPWPRPQPAAPDPASRPNVQHHFWMCGLLRGSYTP